MIKIMKKKNYQNYQNWSQDYQWRQIKKNYKLNMKELNLHLKKNKNMHIYINHPMLKISF